MIVLTDDVNCNLMCLKIVALLLWLWFGCLLLGGVECRPNNIIDRGWKDFFVIAAFLPEIRSISNDIR